MSAADLLQDLARDRLADRLWQDFTSTYREIQSLRETLAMKEGRLADLAEELQDIGSPFSRSARGVLLADVT